MTKVLSQNLYQAAKSAYLAASKQGKQAKTLPILSYARIYTHEDKIIMQAVDSSGETRELLQADSPARVEADSEYYHGRPFFVGDFCDSACLEKYMLDVYGELDAEDPHRKIADRAIREVIL